MGADGDDRRGHLRWRVDEQRPLRKAEVGQPEVANEPVNHGWSRSQAAVSAPSATSWIIGVKSPPEPNVPRTLWITT